METGELACEIRPTRPKHHARALRREGRVPAILYGPTTAPTPIELSAAELKARIAAAAKMRLIRLKSSAPELDGKHVIFKDLQRAPVSGEVLHADLYEVDLKRPIRVQVPLKFTGRAKGVALGGILQPLERAATVECLPLEIPEAIEVDVSDIGIHDVIHVSSLKFAGNVRPIFDTDYPVVTVLPPTVAEAPTPAAAPAEGVPAEGEAAPEAGAAGAAPAEGAAKEGAAPAASAQPAAQAAGKKAEPAPKK
jgi:large subunit ribosomal protein L25